MIDILKLQTFLRVVDAGSINKAATQLAYTPSAVSQQLTKFERELGVVLLERFATGVRLTASGQILSETGRRLLQDVESIRGQLMDQRPDIADTVRVAIFATAAQTMAVSVLQELRELQPDLHVALYEVPADQAIPLLTQGVVDLALVHRWAPDESTPDPGTMTGIETVVIGVDPVDVLAPVGHPLTLRSEVEFAECAEYPWIQTVSGSVFDTWLTERFKALGLTIDPAHRSNEFTTQIALVEAGEGLALVPRVGRKRLSEQVRVVPLRGAPKREIFMAWRTGSDSRPSLRVLRQSFRRSWGFWAD